MDWYKPDSPSTYMFLVADGNFATIPSTSLVRKTWHPSRDLVLALSLLWVTQSRDNHALTGIMKQGVEGM
jgi:hypothetical protein